MTKTEAGQRLSEAEISMILDTYMYFDYKEALEGATLKEVILDLRDHPDYGGGGIHYGEYQVLEEAVQYEQVGNLMLYCQSSDMGYDSGTAAITFVSKEENAVYVVYRGTGDGEWMDNGIGMTAVSTMQQNRALEYFEEAVEKMGIGAQHRVIVTGHSKGGNKAQFVTMETEYPERIDACYTVDGQGFSGQAAEEWKRRYGAEGYADRTGKIHGIHGENDFVSVLGYSIIPGDQIRYVRTPVEKTNLAGCHDIKYMFASMEYNPEKECYVTVFHGRKNADTAKRGELGNYAAALSGEMMKLEDERLDGCAAVIMQIMELTGGRPDGINDEKISLSDLADFTVQGIPLIAVSFLERREGRTLISALMEQERLSDELKGEAQIQIKEMQMLQKARQLQETVDKLNGRIREIQSMAKNIPVFMKGSGILYLRLKRIAKAMQEQANQLQKMALIEIQAVQLYRRWQKII